MTCRSPTGGNVTFRISAKPYKHVKGVLEGSDAHLDILETALESDEWKTGTAEALFHDENAESHMSVDRIIESFPHCSRTSCHYSELRTWNIMH